MNGLKAEIRSAINAARIYRRGGYAAYAAHYLNRAGELRRTVFYVYGDHS